jgi:6-pyruvoyltetrahydropterin/6-carboxytetrahydropterin synthase
MKAHLSRRYHFSASHRLHTESYDAARNAAVFGKCNNPHGHGHNYTVQVTLSGQIDPATGMVCSLTELDAFAQTNLLERFDHTNLNMLDCFRDTVPTTECRDLSNLSTLHRSPSGAGSCGGDKQ